MSVWADSIVVDRDRGGRSDDNDFDEEQSWSLGDFSIQILCMGVPSEISLPTNKPDIRPNLGEGVRW